MLRIGELNIPQISIMENYNHAAQGLPQDIPLSGRLISIEELKLA